MRQTSRDEFFLRAMLSDAWSAVTARPVRSGTRQPAVFIHDPRARKSKNMGDPFTEPKVHDGLGKWGGAPVKQPRK